jgi:hypothetical protein
MSSKKTKGGKQATTPAQAKPAATTPPAGAAGATPQAAKVLYMQVKPGVKYRGARAAWYERAQKYEGKPVAAYLENCKEDPPSLPKSGVAEAPQGWLSFFTRQGVVTLAEKPA